MATIIQTRRDTEADWTAANPLLADGEIGLETDTNKLKVGDGTNVWNSLPYYLDSRFAAKLEAADINTLAELNSIVTDATLIDTTDSRLSDARTPTAHTHVAADVTDFDTAVSANASVVANTAKVSNATHTNEVTGSVALTVDPSAITNKTAIVPDSGDYVLVSDTSDTGALKKSLVSDFAGGGDVATDTLWDALGDLVVGTGANTAARLGIGATGEVLTVAGGTATWAASTGGATQLSELSDVTTSTPTNGYALIADGAAFASRALVEADISNLGAYLENVVEDTTPQLGGDLDAQLNDLLNVGLLRGGSAAAGTLTLRGSSDTAKGWIEHDGASKFVDTMGTEANYNMVVDYNVTIDDTTPIYTGFIEYKPNVTLDYLVSFVFCLDATPVVTSSADASLYTSFLLFRGNPTIKATSKDVDSTYVASAMNTLYSSPVCLLDTAYNMNVGVSTNDHCAVNYRPTLKTTTDAGAHTLTMIPPCSGLVMNPIFDSGSSTGTTAFGDIFGVRMEKPSEGSSVGSIAYERYIGLWMQNITATKATTETCVVKSELAANAKHWFLKNASTAQTDLGTSNFGINGATPVGQQGAIGSTGVVNAGSGSTVFRNTTFNGGTGSTAYTIGDIVRALKNYGWIAT